MRKLVAVTVLVLGALVGMGWYFGLFDEFPSQWEWFFGILSVVGFVVGTLIFPQLAWGQPRLRTEFHVESTEAQTHLSLMFNNPQVQKKLLRSIGVHRQAIQSLVVNFRIAEAGSGKILLPIHQALIYSDEDQDDKGRYRISLAPTYSVGATVLVAVWDYKVRQAIVPPDRLRNPLVLPPGQYRADIIVLIDGEPSHKSSQFVVGAKPEELFWVPRLTTKK
jgi:hypothetical protein